MVEIANYTVPTGLAAMAGGTRTRIALSRPWQRPIEADGYCPFDRLGAEDVLRSFDGNRRWHLLSNPASPFTGARLIVPESCWPDAVMRTLGTVEDIADVLHLVARLAIADGAQKATWLGVHVGASAGQNLAHLHFHLIEPARAVCFPPMESAVEVRRVSGLTVAAGGLRAGQCVVQPDAPAPVADAQSRLAVARTVNSMLVAGASAFRSAEGLEPDFALSFHLHQDRFVSALYTPILNHLGFTEYIGLTYGSQLILPWTHESSAELLRAHWPDPE